MAQGEGALHSISLIERIVTHPYHPPYYLTDVVHKVDRPPSRPAPSLRRRAGEAGVLAAASHAGGCTGGQ